MKKFAVAHPMFACFVVLLVVSGATAGPTNRRTKITFSQPVRVPGVTLSAGTYYFSAPVGNNRALVRVEDENRNIVTQFMGIADYTNKTDHDIIVFGDHECGPKAVKSWFYPSADSFIRKKKQPRSLLPATSLSQKQKRTRGMLNRYRLLVFT
jgi:hypothetical protein